MQNASALLWHFVSDMFRPVVLAAKVHRAERRLDRAAQKARQACVESNTQTVAQAYACWCLLALRRLLSAPEHASGCPKLRPAKPNPLGLRWPTTQVLGLGLGFGLGLEIGLGSFDLAGYSQASSQ